MNELEAPTARKYIRVGKLSLLATVVLTVLGGYAGLVTLNSPPEEFPLNTRISIEEGSSLNDISHTLARARVVRSAFLFRAIIAFYGEQSSLRAGVYMFTEPLSTFAVARSFIDQSSSIPPIKVTIPEGATLANFDSILASELPHIEPGDIEAAASGTEGILFPDTYLIQEDWSADEIVLLLRETFEKKMLPYADVIASSTLSEQEVIILASIVEKEGKDPDSMKLVAGILLKRIRINMPLQADATFAYTLGKTSAELTSADLENDSPFNTYRRKGLPPGPIGSPGLTAIEAVVHPTSSEYLYYLTDENGVFHYAKTFDEHKENKAKYLR